MEEDKLKSMRQILSYEKEVEGFADSLKSLRGEINTNKAANDLV